MCVVLNVSELSEAVLQACQEKSLSACGSCVGFGLYNGSTNAALLSVLSRNNCSLGRVSRTSGRKRLHVLLARPILTLSQVSVRLD